jgi:hypothetical protein
MRAPTLLLTVCVILILAILIGVKKDISQRPQETAGPAVPHIGRIEVLNGCGLSGAGDTLADFLRNRGFDVKYIGNAETWNYPFTLVASRTRDASIARQVCAALKTDKLVLLRTGDEQYDATVFVGADFSERLQ